MDDSAERDRLIPDRRQSPRHPATRLPSLRASILAGPDVQVINVSRRGLLVESDVRLVPWAGVCLHITSDDQIYTVGGRIVRVDAALVGGRLKYRAGVLLDKDFAIFDLSTEQSVLASVLDTSGDTASSPERQPEIESEPGASTVTTRQDVPRPRAEASQRPEAFEKLQVAVAVSETYQKRTAESHAAERARWDAERRALETRLRDAERQADELSRHLAAAREAEQRLAREHQEERTKLEAALHALQQQLSELEGHQAALIATSTQHLKTYEQEREDWATQTSRLSTQLEQTEAWCTDQQDLLYNIRQEMSRVFALMTRVRPRPTLEPAESPAIEANTTIIDT
jgi:hypothetical protein